MTSISSPTISTSQLDLALEYAVIRSWDDLMPNSASGLIHVEYQTSLDGSLDFFKIWASTLRGYWSLICECWMRPLWSHTTGLRFENDYHSGILARTLEYVMRHEDSFAKLPERHGLIQVYPPTTAQRGEAERWGTETFGDMGSSLVKSSVAV